MSIPETLLVFAGIPAGIIAVVTVMVYGRTWVHQPNRYRVGKPWTYPPQWFVPHPEAVGHPVAGQRALDGSSTTHSVGGATGEW